MENLSQSQALKRLGLKEKDEWLLYDDKGKKFFQYLAENVSNINILTSQEYEFSQNQECLKGKELDVEVETLGNFFNGLFEASEKSIEEMEEEIRFWNSDTANSQLRTSRIEESEKHQLKMLEKTDKDKVNFSLQKQDVVSSCLAQSEKLQDLQLSNQAKIRQSKEMYLQPVSIYELYETTFPD